MLVLFETAAGYALFKLLDDDSISDFDAIADKFGSPSSLNDNLQLLSFKKFKDANSALKSIRDLTEAKLPKDLSKFLEKNAQTSEKLIVGDKTLGSAIKEQLKLKCMSTSTTTELFRMMRSHLDTLLSDYRDELQTMKLALSHSVGRYKVQFNPEKIDTMIVQAVSLLDDLDKELNNYAMRLREWYGWHFPEISKIIPDHGAFARAVMAMGLKENAHTTDLGKVLPEDLAEKVKHEASISMGSEMSEIDIILIKQLCAQVIEMSDYRASLYEYLKNRMTVLAPNLTVLLGELIGARLICRAGSLVNLAKCPASTVQILGAEKALFRALKSKRDTPKYGVIYHAQLVTKASTKVKGKMARKLAAKISLSTRIDALCDDNTDNSTGLAAREALETQLSLAEGRGARAVKTGANGKKDKLSFRSEVHDYDDSADVTVKSKKRTFDSDDEEQERPAKKSKKNNNHEE